MGGVSIINSLNDIYSYKSMKEDDKNTKVFFKVYTIGTDLILKSINLILMELLNYQ